jgi:glyoxylase-like metal-dependent hydrolase (beta-lactamase superfamily II)
MSWSPNDKDVVARTDRTNRTEPRTFRSGVWIAVAIAAASLSAQRAEPIVVKQLKPDVYIATGGGGNSGIVIGTDGVIVIDAKNAPESGKALVAEVAKLTPKPITHVILTHGDPDHVNGLAGFPPNVTVVAYDNAKTQMETAIAAAGRGGALPATRLPSTLITRTGETMTIAGVRVELRHWAPAHTSGDLVVILPAARVAFTGDIVPATTSDPVIHLDKRGSSEGWITATKGVLGYGVQYVPGHGAVKTRTELQSILTAVSEKRDWIVSLVKEGKPLEEIRRTVGDPAPPARPPAPPAVKGRAQAPSPVRSTPLTFTETVYQELTKRGSGVLKF